MMRFLYLCVGLMILVSCDKAADHDAQTPLVIITSPDNPPFEFKDTAKGGDEVIGFDMDVAHKLSEHLGRPVKIMEADFSAIIPSLQSGRADMAISTIAATDERRKSVDFSDPYYQQELALLVLEDALLETEKHLAGKALGVQTGTTHETLGYKWVKETPPLTIISLSKMGELVQELKNHRVHAVLTEGETARRIASATPGIKAVPLEVKGEELAIVFPKGSPWVAPVNEKLKIMNKDIQNIATKWLKTK